MKLCIGLIQLRANPKTETFIAELLNSVHTEGVENSKGLTIFNLKKIYVSIKLKSKTS